MQQHYALQQYVLHTSAVCDSTTNFGSLYHTLLACVAALHASAVCATHFNSMYCIRQKYVQHTSAVCDSTTHCNSMYYIPQQYTATLHTSAVCGSTTHFSSVYYELQQYAIALHTAAVCTTHSRLNTSVVCDSTLQRYTTILHT